MPNPIVHWELMVDDVEKSKKFYRQVFDWKFVDQAGGEYTLIDVGSEPGGGLMKRPPDAPFPSMNTYFRVDDLQKTLRNAVEAGATVIVPKMEIQGIGWFAMFQDPSRIPVGVMQLKSAGP
jgi:uncharacterized protein